MIRAIFLSLFFVATLFSADLNLSLADANSSVYKNLLNSIDAKTPESKLQKTLISKILSIKNNETKSFNNEKIKTQNDFLNSFFDIVKMVSRAKKDKNDIENIKEQLDDIKDQIASLDKNATNLITLQLEYAYYYKRYKYLKKEVENIEKSYKEWIKTLLSNLKKIDFDTKNQDSKIKTINKKISYIQNKIKKLSIEKERWKFLNKKNYVENLDKEIKRLSSLKDRYLTQKIKTELISFFKAAQKRSEEVFKIKEKILKDASKLSDKNFKESLEMVLDITLIESMGEKATIFYQLKNNTISFLTKNNFLGIPFYKIVLAVGVFLLFLILRKIFALIVLKSFEKIVAKTKTKIDDTLLQIVDSPLKFAFIIAGFYIALLVMGVENEMLFKIAKSLVIFDIFWLFYSSIDLLQKPIYKFSKKFGQELYREIGNFFIKTLKIFIFSIGLVAILEEWSINVSAFIASLGLGGLAFALAAKDTAANLFGGLTILADRSLKIDDWIKVDGVEGTVEDIGLRSIKVRTFEKSLITVPNQIVANNPIENFSRRDIRRIKMRIGVTYSTTKEQLEKILNDIRDMLKSHPGIEKTATMLVNFDEFEDSSLSIFIYCFTNTADWGKYLQIREDINLKIMDIIEKNGSDFAFPSQSIYVEKINMSGDR